MDQLNIQEDLAFIRKVINDTRQCFIYDGKSFIIWGILVIIGQIANYFTIIYGVAKYDWYMWTALALVGWFWSIWEYRQKRITVKAITITERAINAVWGSCGITMMILIFLAPAIKVYNVAFVDPMVCSILGIAYFTTGTLSFKWMRYNAFGWWLGALIMFIWPGLYEMLFLPALLLVLQVIPGFVMYYQWKKITTSN
jgi:hypothetical protein